MHDAVADKVHGASKRDLTQGRFPEAIAIATASKESGRPISTL